MINVSQAAVLAKSYTTLKESDTGDHVLRLMPNRIVAINETAGISVACELAAQALVNAKQFTAVMKKCPSPEITATPQGRRVDITTSDRGSFSVAGVTVKRLRPIPEFPGDAGWIELSEPETKAIVSLASLADHRSADETRAGILLTPTASIINAGDMFGVAWVTCALRAPVLVPSKFWKGITGPVRVKVKGGRFWLTDSKSTRWVRVLTADYPEHQLMTVLGRVRSNPQRQRCTVDIKALCALAKRALAASENPADVFILEWTPTGLVLQGGGTTAAYRGELVAEGGDNRRIGTEPKTVADCSTALLKASKGHATYASIVSEQAPLVLWCVAPVAIEIVINPAYIPRDQ